METKASINPEITQTARLKQRGWHLRDNTFFSSSYFTGVTTAWAKKKLLEDLRQSGTFKGIDLPKINILAFLLTLILFKTI